MVASSPLPLPKQSRGATTRPVEGSLANTPQHRFQTPNSIIFGATRCGIERELEGWRNTLGWCVGDSDYETTYPSDPAAALEPQRAIVTDPTTLEPTGSNANLSWEPPFHPILPRRLERWWSACSTSAALLHTHDIVNGGSRARLGMALCWWTKGTLLSNLIATRRGWVRF